MAQRSGLTVGRLARAAGPLLVLAFLINATIVTIAIQGFNVPGDNDMIDFPILLFASIGPVLGNCIGFLAAYIRPNRASLIGFLAPGVLITIGFVVLAVVEALDHDDLGLLITSLLVTVTPTVVAAVGLIRRREELLAPAVAASGPGGSASSGPTGLPAGQAVSVAGSGGGSGGDTVRATGEWTPAQLAGEPRPAASDAGLPDVAATGRWELRDIPPGQRPSSSQQEPGQAGQAASTTPDDDQGATRDIPLDPDNPRPDGPRPHSLEEWKR